MDAEGPHSTDARQRESLLTTRLRVPPTRSRLVRRRRLVERLNAGLAHALTLVSAPAGYGKTTLVAEWLGSLGSPYAWLSLEAGDNDPARFATYLQTAVPSIGRAAAAMLNRPEPPPPEAFLTALLVDDVAASLPSRQGFAGRILRTRQPGAPLVAVTRALAHATDDASAEEHQCRLL